MGVSQHVDYDKYPKQGEVGARVRVCFNYDTERTIGGYVLRDDFTEPYRMVIKLDDGRTVFASECQYQFEHWHEVSERATRLLPDFWELLDDRIEHWRIEHYRELAGWGQRQHKQLHTMVQNAEEAITKRWYEARARVALGWAYDVCTRNSEMRLGETFAWLLRSSEQARDLTYSFQDLAKAFQVSAALEMGGQR